MDFANLEIYFSYGQFLVYDNSVPLPGCAWTDLHTRQGFARRTSAVCFRTVLEFGNAQVRVCLDADIEDEDFHRAVSVPLFLPTGEVFIEGPEESSDVPHLLLDPGHYKLTALQKVLDEEEEIIQLRFQKLTEPAQFSEILIADDDLDPPEQLLEDAEVA